MGQLVNIRAGRWNKTDEGRWKFEEDNSEVYHYIVARTNEGFEEFTKLVRQQLRIEDLCPLLVTYQLPGCMVQDDPSAHAPITLLTSEDIEIMMSVKEWKNEVVTCVTYGALNIAKYQFLCRSPFTIGDTTYLADGITEEVHCRMINSMVEDDEFTCAGSVLKQLFSEEKLILVYRFSFEIEEARKFFDRFPTPEIGGTRRETQKSRTTTQRKKSQNCGTQDKGDYQCPSDYPEEAIIRLNVDEDAAYLNADWEDVVAGQQNVGHGIDPECYVTEATPHNLTSLSNGDQRSTSCLNINVVDLVTSSTGSTGDVNVTVIGNTCWNPITVPWGDNSDRGETSMRPSKTFQGATEEEMTELLPQLYVNVNDDSDIPLSPKLQTPRRQSIIGEDDSGSLIVGKKEVGADNQSDIYVGMIFNSREDFKLHMAMYAIRNKFRLRHSRSSPGGMVLTCFSETCKWRVYAVILKNTQLYEIRKSS
ncbi:uncharacterized protein LOC106422293 [Brassica napus]|uniref:uncharacterized protein LOC106422293 n=1 Tax=Brassica napus TaxID=3708 RepID=UPI0020790CEC|nr:uncharacterized protein LOC106422293 [Brassica napus]